MSFLPLPRVLSRFALWSCLLISPTLVPGAPATIDPPVSPNATPEVRALLTYLNGLSGNHILAGQQEDVSVPSWHTYGDNVEMDYLLRTTGRLPVIRGYDFIWYMYSADIARGQTLASRATQWSRSGGIVQAAVHWFTEIGSPPGSVQFYTPSGTKVGTTFDIRQAVIEGTPENLEFVAKMDRMAAELIKLRDAHVPVIWRPFHECSGNQWGAWFWWGAKGAEPLKQAWRYMFDRFTRVHGLNNLIWCFNPTLDVPTFLADWYPGDDVVDIISLDVYPPAGTHPTYGAQYRQMHDFRSGRKVVTLSENGDIPDPDRLSAEGADWPSFCTWSGSFITGTANNPPAFVQRVYSHARVLTLDEMPDVYYYPPTTPATITDQPVSQAVAAGGSATLSVSATAASTALAYQWQHDGVAVAGTTTSQLTLAAVQPEQAGIYIAKAFSGGGVTYSQPAVVGPLPSGRTAGSVITRPEWQDIHHPNGHTYDQFLLTGAAGTITADPDQIARISFLDERNSIVQVEMSGPGAVTVRLHNASGPLAPALYNQSGIDYMQGAPSITLVGAEATTYMSIFSVGPANNPGVTRADATYDGWANVRAVGIQSATGALGGLFYGNVLFTSDRGPAGLVAPTIRTVGTLNLHEITAWENGQPLLLLDSQAQVNVRLTGGSLEQLNGRPLTVAGLASLQMGAGRSSAGIDAPSQPNRGQLLRNGVDVTTTLIVGP